LSRRIKNWNKFQHFKDRRPPWIKVYRELLDDVEWFDMNAKDCKSLLMLWLLASEDETMMGTLPNDKQVCHRLRMSEAALKELYTRLDQWIVGDDIKAISERYQDDTPETETETETETEKKPFFVPTDSSLKWAATKTLSYLVDLETEKFINYHQSRGTKFKDWQAAWRNWMLKAQEYNPSSPPKITSCDKCDRGDIKGKFCTCPAGVELKRRVTESHAKHS